MRIVRALAFVASIFAGLAIASCGPAPSGAAIAPAGQLPDAVAPQRYALDFQIDPAKETFTGHAVIEVVLKERGRRLYMHGAGLHVTGVHLETAEGARVKARYREILSSGVAQIDLERAAGPGAAKLVFDYTARFNGNLAGLYRSEQDGLWYAMTQFEPVDARMAFPSFDEPRFKTPFDVTITAPQGLVAISNGPEIKKETLADGRQRHIFAPTPPLPTYLVALAVGPYDIVEAPPIAANDLRRVAIPLRGFATKGKGPQLQYALTRMPPIVNALEEYFNVPYPFAKLDVIAAPDFEAGAMENAGLIAFREQFLLLDDSAGVSRKRDFLLIAAHELAHQWFGNLVTPQWWDDIWLNEAFATWMEAKIAAQIDPSGDYLRGIQRDALDAMSLDSLTDVRRIHEPVLRSEEIEDAFDAITYKKGAAVLSMFERYLGEETFRAGVHRHLERFAQDSATSDDFFQSMAQGAQRPEIVPAFKSFVDRPGVPLVGATPNCGDPVAGPQISMRQSRYAPMGSRITVGEPWIIPACFAGISKGARTETCVLLDRLEQTAPAASCPSYMMPNSGGYGYYRMALDSKSAKTLLDLRSALSAGESLAFIDSLDAAFKNGALDSATYLEGLRTAAANQAWDVASFPAGLEGRSGPLENLVKTIAPEARDNFAAFMRGLYGPRLQNALSAGGDPLLREAVVRAVAIQGRDPNLRAALASRVLPSLGFPEPIGGAQPLDEDLRESAMIAAVQDGGKPVLDALFIALKTARDQQFRADAVKAIGAVEEQALHANILKSALDANLSGREIYDLIAAMMANPYAKDATWIWLKRNYAAFAQRIPEARKPDAPFLTRYFCSAEAATDTTRFFSKSSYKASPRVTAMAAEKINLCAALKKARGNDLRAALSAAAVTPQAPITFLLPSSTPAQRPSKAPTQAVIGTSAPATNSGAPGPKESSAPAAP